METSNFDRLLERYLNGQTTEEETRKIEGWLDIEKIHNRSGERHSREMEERLFQKIVSKHPDLAGLRGIIPSKKKVSPSQWIFRIAAALTLIALMSYIGWYVGKSDNGGIQVASTGVVKKVILEDGSLVWLKGNSKIVYYENKNEGIRYSELKGEALYEIAKDANRPFIVNCGDVRLKVLGTSFSVKMHGDSMELQVLTGKVNLSTDADAMGVDVLPNQKAVFANGKINKLSINVHEALSAIADTEYNLKFVNTPLEEVVAGLEKKFDARIKIENKDAGRCGLTIDLVDQSLEHALEMITEVLDVNYERDGESFVIRGHGCR